MRDASGKKTVTLDGRFARLTLGQEGSDGDLIVRDDSGQDVFIVNGERAEAFIGVKGRAGKLHMRDESGKNTVTLDGRKGDISFANADCAEEFPAARDEVLQPGTVVVLDDQGKVLPSREAYDRRVAGVISGIGELKPAIVFGVAGAGVPVPACRCRRAGARHGSSEVMSHLPPRALRTVSRLPAAPGGSGGWR